METDQEESRINLTAISIDHLLLPELEARELQADVLRLDKVNRVVSGNKWFKLKHHLEAARRNNHSILITFGGAYSNHLVATACACRQHGLQSVGIVRGEKPVHLSVTLKTAVSYGMQLHFVSREAYAQKEGEEIQKWIASYHHPYLVPEGGAGDAGIRGCREILPLADYRTYSHILCCIGTGTMFKGLLQSKTAEQQLIGIPVLKLDAGSLLIRSLNQFIEDQGSGSSCRLLLQYHFGGYAKKTPALLRFMNRFYERTDIPTDFVYTGKLMAACMELAEQGFFPPGSRLLVIHSGGLQGNGSLPSHTLVF